MTLNDLKCGDTAQIAKIDLLSPYAIRLLDLGFVPDSTVKLLARSPVGNTLLLSLRRRTLMLRSEEAGAVFIIREENA